LNLSDRKTIRFALFSLQNKGLKNKNSGAPIISQKKKAAGATALAAFL
jgi:hypothetical protein